MTSKEQPAPGRSITVDETNFSFLWWHTAVMVLKYFGLAAGTPPISDAERLDAFARLGLLYHQHRDALPDEADLVMYWLLTRAQDLVEVSGH
jgi:hypothetical protein